MNDKKKGNIAIGLGVVLPILAASTEGSPNEEDIKVVRVEKRRSKWGGKEHMKAMSRGRLFNPGEKVVGLAITLEGSDPQVLRTHQMVRPILIQEASKHLRKFAPMIVFRNVYQSRTKPDTWEAIWDLS